MKKILFAAAGAILAAASPVMACGPFFQPSYICQEKYRIVLKHEAAMTRLANSLSGFLREKDIFAEGKSTKEAVVDDFNAALDRYMPKANRVRKKFYSFVYLKLNSSKALPSAMQEFALYRKGVKEMASFDGSMPASWQKLLSLPPEKRHFRTVWVHYMMGNLLKGAECHKYYRSCRDAVRAGFADTAGLARASLRNEYEYGIDPVLRIHAAIAFQRHDPSEVYIDKRYKSVPWQKIAPSPEMMKDELFRELLAALNNQTPEFLVEMQKYKFRNTDIMAYHAWQDGNWSAAQHYVDLMNKPTLLSTYIEVQLARMAGKNEVALEKLRRWVRMAKKIDPADSASMIVRRVAGYDEGTFEHEIYGILGNAMVLRKDFIQAAEFFCQSGQVESDFAMVADDYMSLAELVKFTDLRIAKHKKEATPTEEDAKLVKIMSHLLARRAFRENRMDIALKYMPAEYRKLLQNYLQFIALGDNKNLSGDQRALALYNAARIMRLHGMELCGKETEPDNFRYEGGYGPAVGFMACKKCSYKHPVGKWILCAEHKYGVENFVFVGGARCEKCSYTNGVYPTWKPCARHAAAAEKSMLPGLGAEIDWKKIPSHWRFHYRYRAARIALQAAALARDPELKALINYSAGTMLAPRSPQEADVFYKQLVSQCKGTKLADAANAARWFPKNKVLEEDQKKLRYYTALKDVHRLLNEAFPVQN